MYHSLIISGCSVIIDPCFLANLHVHNITACMNAVNKYVIDLDKTCSLNLASNIFTQITSVVEVEIKIGEKPCNVNYTSMDPNTIYSHTYNL